SRNWGNNSNYGENYNRRNRGYYNDHDNYRGSRDWHHDDDRTFFERAGDRIRETWNRWTDDDDDRRSGYPRRNDNRDEYGDNMFQRAGRRIRDTWRDWTNSDDRDNYSRDYDDDGRDYDYRRNYGNTNEWMDNRS